MNRVAREHPGALEEEDFCHAFGMDSAILKFAKLLKNASSPRRGSNIAAGNDLCR
jgi:hypothetical protein